jgi:hypothetical protein
MIKWGFAWKCNRFHLTKFSREFLVITLVSINENGVMTAHQSGDDNTKVPFCASDDAKMGLETHQSLLFHL